MDLEHLLRNWDYEQAKKLYLEYGENQTFRMLLQQPKSSHTERKLKRTIRQWMDSNFLGHQQIPIPTKSVEIVENDVEKVAEEITQEEKRINERWRSNYKKMSRLQMSLIHAESDEIRKEMAFEILDLRDLVFDDWRNLDYFQEHGTWMPQAVEIDLDWTKFSAVELEQQLRNLRTYLSPSKAKIYSEEKRAEFRAKVQLIEQMLPEMDTD